MKFRSIVLIFILTGIITSCSRIYRSSVMLRAPKDYAYSKIDSVDHMEFRIQPNDILDFRLYTNDGFKLIDLSTLNDNTRVYAQTMNVTYLIEHDGQVKLPIIGRINVKDKTIKETEKILEAAYAKYYIDPFAKLEIVNRRVLVFNGEYSQGQVVEMKNRNMTLMEALAMAGGIPKSGKSYKIKLIRNNNTDHPKIFFLNLAKIDDRWKTAIVLQSNDVIYVEPRISLPSELLREFAPIITMVTSILSLTILVSSF